MKLAEKIITIEEVLKRNLCEDYDSKEKLKILSGGKSSLTLKEILNLKIPATDILWFVLDGEVLPSSLLHELSCKFAEQALNVPNIKVDERSVYAIRIKREWLRKEATNEKLKTAQKEAYAAACYIANAANAASTSDADAYVTSANAANAACAYACARAASTSDADAYVTSADAAYAYAYATATAAATAAAAYTYAYAACRKKQIEMVKEILKYY